MSECINCHKMDGAVCQKCWSELCAENEKSRNLNEILRIGSGILEKLKNKTADLEALNARLLEGLKEQIKATNMPDSSIACPDSTTKRSKALIAEAKEVVK